MGDQILTDTFDRPLSNLRVSVTDRCNLRCSYCMPEENYKWLPREDLLSFEEINTLVDLFTQLGIRKVRFTGGEPLLRRHLASLVKMVAQNPRIEDLAITTNGILLAEQAQPLREAGLHRVTVSLDTLRPARFKALTRRDDHKKVLEGIQAAVKVGFEKLKLDAVVIRGINDDELVDLIEFGREVRAEVRFIEYMDVGGATQWTMKKVFSRLEILDSLKEHYGPIERVIENSSAPAQRYLLPGGTSFGIIASTTTPFCRTCDRSRLMADGLWYLCLYAQRGIDLRRLIRNGASAEEIKTVIEAAWKQRRDRGAEERKELGSRGVLVPVDRLKKDPHLEMHTRGG